MLSAIDFDRKVDRHTPPAKEYSNSDILKSMLIGILCGNADFEAIHETDDAPEYFCNAFHMKHLPSEATMRQRMDEIGDSLRDTLRMANVSLFKEYGIEAAGGHPHEKTCETPQAAHSIGAHRHDPGRCDEACKKNRRRPWPE